MNTRNEIKGLQSHTSIFFFCFFSCIFSLHYISQQLNLVSYKLYMKVHMGFYYQIISFVITRDMWVEDTTTLVSCDTNLVYTEGMFYLK